MKKLIALILSLSMVILIFASCDASREEESSITLPELSSTEPSSTEPSSVASSDTEFSSVPDNSSIIDTSHSGDGVTSVKSPIPYTEEDEQYYNQYTKNFFSVSCKF